MLLTTWLIHLNIIDIHTADNDDVSIAAFAPSRQDQILDDVTGRNYSAIGYVIMNPDSGPGAASDPEYVAQVKRVRAADPRMKILGYSHTSYGARPVADVLAEIDDYYSWCVIFSHSLLLPCERGELSRGHSGWQLCS